MHNLWKICEFPANALWFLIGKTTYTIPQASIVDNVSVYKHPSFPTLSTSIHSLLHTRVLVFYPEVMWAISTVSTPLIIKAIGLKKKKRYNYSYEAHN